VVALFVIAEPIKRLGKFTFADALDAKFHSRGIKLTAAISTLVVSIFYLIPQMVGAGALVKPLLGLPHYAGVLIVGAVVIVIVVTAGMVSTTWVQFIKGSLLVVFCFVLVVLILRRGVVSIEKPRHAKAGDLRLVERVAFFDAKAKAFLEDYEPDLAASRGFAVGPFEFLRILQTIAVAKTVPHTVIQAGSYRGHSYTGGTGDLIITPVELLSGGSPTFKGVRSARLFDKLDFISLMLALFCGTASLPHILIRYYTVKDAASARKSTVVGIASIGFFYILTLYIGLGAMVSGNLDPTDSNMAAPLLARSFGELPFAVISAIAFTTVLGTVSGLIMAASGAVAHDIMTNFMQLQLDDHQKVRAGKIVAGRRRRGGDGAGRRVQGDERELPRRLGLQRRGQREPAGVDHAAVLARHDQAGDHRIDHDRHARQPGVDPAEPAVLQGRVWGRSDEIDHPVQPAGTGDDPAGIHCAGGGVDGDGRRGTGEGV
jgi:cation/acetate symporter